MFVYKSHIVFYIGCPIGLKSMHIAFMIFLFLSSPSALDPQFIVMPHLCD